MAKQLSDGFKKSVYWNNYQTIPTKVVNDDTTMYRLVSASFQVVRRLFILAYPFAANAANNGASIKGNKIIFFQEQKLKIMI